MHSGHEVLEIGQGITCKVFTRLSIPGFRRGRSCACESQFIEFIEVNESVVAQWLAHLPLVVEVPG